jgi:uncharacterized protein YegL
MNENNTRRLPVYLVLDTSGSMAGEPLESVRQGIKAMLSDLRSDPMALENAYLSVITFADSAVQVAPLTDLMSFQEPVLNAGGYTSLGQALTLLEDKLASECHKGTHHEKGDYKPLVFLMTDGQPTDSWEAAADRVKQQKPANIIACAAGPGADSKLLQRITETVVELKTLQPEQMRAFFKWVSRSVKVASMAINSPNAVSPGAVLPAPPVNSGIQIVI